MTTCFGWHSYEYGEVRDVAMQRQRTIGGEPIGDPVAYVEERQYRTCTVCGKVQDRKVGTY